MKKEDDIFKFDKKTETKPHVSHNFIKKNYTFHINDLLFLHDLGV